MGAWDCNITGNDTAQDLRTEYKAAFYYNDVEIALKKINNYVREDGFDESDESVWCDYYYSLADFMWSKGIFTDDVKNKTLKMIDGGFGLEIWKESGESTLNSRKKVLQKFRSKITSPQPPKKKITFNIQTKPIFEQGDIITFQLQTENKVYTGNQKNVNQSDFKKADGKYLVVRKIYDICSWSSRIEPSVKNLWSAFQLYDKLFGEPPKLNDVIDLNTVEFNLPNSNAFDVSDGINHDGIFLCESNLFYFRKRKYKLLGNSQNNIEPLIGKYKLDTRASYFNLIKHIYFSINTLYNTADEDLLNGISNIK